MAPTLTIWEKKLQSLLTQSLRSVNEEEPL